MTPTINSTKKTAKSSGRQTNNSLSSITGNIFIDSTSNAKSKDSNQINSNAAPAAAVGGKTNEAKKAASKILINSKTNAKTEKKCARNQSTVKQKASSSLV